MFPCVFWGFLNDPDRSVYVGDFSIECAALDAAGEVRGVGDPEVGALDQLEGEEVRPQVFINPPTAEHSGMLAIHCSG